MKRSRRLAHWLTGPARRTALPILRGNARGLRVSFGESNLSRIVRAAESQVEDKLLELVRPGDVVYDLGANIGWYSLLAARRVGPGGQVVAFEPAIENAAHLQRNAASNGFANIVVVPAAVSDRNGWAMFLNRGSLESRLEESDDDAQAKRRASQVRESRGRTPVPMVTLDAWISAAEQAPPSLVKIDIEGAEIGALGGMKATLRTAKPMLIIELHGTRDAVLDLLDSSDYEYEAIESELPMREAPGGVHVLARARA
jgi:FkbM family methyltransferase